VIRWLADENFSGLVVRGLLRREPSIDLLRVQDVGLAGADDLTILAWCAANDRVLITHDSSTVPDYANARVRAGEAMPGVFVAKNTLATAAVIDDLLLASVCSEPEEWDSLVIHLPL
jgi:predicted nuclease of predicted toxin-antitoxin system